MRPALGTFVEIGIPASGDADRAIDQAFAALRDVEARLSFQRPDSELSRLNRSCEPLAMSLLALRVVRLARAMTIASGALFDCTVGGLLVRRGVLPDHGGPEPVDRGDAGDIEIRGSEVRLLRPVRLTLDGIAKGYAVDLAVHALRAMGVAAGWVDAGGDMRVFGAMCIPVHRREADGTLSALGGLQDAALATSMCHDGRQSRFPGSIVQSDGTTPIPSVWSVVARQTWRADALTKVAALASPDARIGLLARLGGRLAQPVCAEAA
jgi:thiamine biosynthesis lipoprotein